MTEHFGMATHAAAIGVGDVVLDDGEWRQVTGSEYDYETEITTLVLDGDTPRTYGSGKRVQRSLRDLGGN